MLSLPGWSSIYLRHKRLKESGSVERFLPFGLRHRVKKSMVMGEIGFVADIQNYSLNDGPGIRTTLFLKGCPLKCKWCHNPEMIAPSQELWYNYQVCTSCGQCIDVCPESAIKGYKEDRVIDREVCTLCMKCVEICPNHVLSPVGRQITVEDALKEFQKDEIFHKHGGGGITISGGEPSFQAHFATELLKQCQDHLINTAIDTCGYASWDVLSGIAEYADLILFDIKHMEAAKHLWGTGVSNELILENARKLAPLGKMRVRVPVIPGFNCSEGDLNEIAKFVVLNGLRSLDLLPYHIYGEGKYKRLGRKYEFAEIQPPTEDQMRSIQALFESKGFEVTIGG